MAPQAQQALLHTVLIANRGEIAVRVWRGRAGTPG